MRMAAARSAWPARPGWPAGAAGAVHDPTVAKASEQTAEAARTLFKVLPRQAQPILEPDVHWPQGLTLFSSMRYTSCELSLFFPRA